MEENANLELLVGSIADYSKSSYDLLKLKLIDKVSDVISSFIPHSIVLIVVLTFLLFCNLGIVFMLGEVFGKIYLGFFAVAAFYAIVGAILHFFMHRWLKKNICNSIIIKLLN